MQRWDRIVFRERARRLAVVLALVAAATAWALWYVFHPSANDRLLAEDCRQRYTTAHSAGDTLMIDQFRPLLGRGDAGRLTCGELRSKGWIE